MPEAAITEYDPYSPEFQADPFAVYRWMLDEAPVFYSEKWNWWALSRWEDVRAAATDHETFLSFEGIDIDATATDQSGPGFLPDIDNPRHDQLRRIVQPHFLPRRIAKHEAHVRDVIRGFVRDWKDRDEIDIAKELAWPAPMEIFFDLIGLPSAQDAARADLERWVHELKDRDPGDDRLTPVAKAATDGIRSYFVELLNERRRNPRQDLITHIVQAEIDGVPLADEDIVAASEVMGLMTILLFGSAETTSGLMSTFFKLVAENPDQRDILLKNPALIGDAVEEAVRYATPLQLVGRTTSREVTVRGVTIPKGGRVVLVYGAANRDPRQFPNPDKFDVTRGAQRHLGFGEGLHGCLGAPLARMDIRVAGEEALPLLGDYSLSRPAVRYRSTPNAYVWENLFVTPAGARQRNSAAGNGSRAPEAQTPAPSAPLSYDPLSYAAFDHPYELYRELRERAPVYYNPRRDLWVLSRYEDVTACLSDHQRFVASMGNDVDATHDTYGPGQLIALDPPHHGRVRDVLGPAFTPERIAALEPHVRQASRNLLAKLRNAGSGDVATGYALPLVFDVSLRLLGLPASEAEYLTERTVASMARTIGRFGLPDDAAAANREVEAHIAEILRQRRTQAPDDGTDVVSLVLDAGRTGVLDDAEQAGLVHLLLSASTDVSAALLTNCVALLDRFPDLQSRLRDEPPLVEGFVEEVLRYESPMKNAARQTASAVTLHGVTIPDNARVLALIASANRDERVHPDPETFDPSRTYTAENTILSFGTGIHSCIGAPLARLMAVVTVQELVAGLAGTEMRVVGVPQRWTKQMARGFATLPVEFVSSRPQLPVRTPHVTSRHIGARRTTSVTLVSSEFEADVRVEAKEIVADGVVALTLREAGGHPLPRWTPGAHADLILGEAPTRQYSLCGDPADPYTWRVGILRDADGRGGSLHVHDRLRVGDTIRVRGPRNNFPLQPSPRYLFVAGGIGITPILTMIASAEAAGAEWELVYGGRQRASMAFLDELAPYGDRVTVSPQDEAGLLDLPSILGTPRPDTLVYCCGPEPLLAAVEQNCTSWPAKSLHVERFAAKPVAEPARADAFEVHLAQSDLTLTVPPERSILDVVEEAGISVLSSCREGTCGSCEIPVVSGEPDHRDSVLDEDDRAANNCLMVCVSRSCGARLVLDL